jgi:hypothetical protein
MTNVAGASINHNVATLAPHAVVSKLALDNIVAAQALGLVNENAKVRIHQNETDLDCSMSIQGIVSSQTRFSAVACE